MAYGFRIGLPLALLLVVGAAAADPQHEHGGGGERSGGHEGGHQSEPHPGPSGYQRVEEPHGWNNRPAAVNRGAYQHNFQAARSYKIGPYHRPVGWVAHRWGYGEMLPRGYWGGQY